MEESQMEPATQALIEQTKRFELWQKNTQENVRDQKCNYPEWQQFSAAFVNLLTTKKPGNWTPVEELAISILCRLPEPERVKLLIQPYSDLVERMYILVCARQCRAINMELCLCYFRFDPSETIRQEALKGLAYERWPEAESHALRLWKTRKTVDRMVALDCLHALDSPLLVEYLQKAAKSRDGHVRRAALAISSIKNIDKMNWPKKK